MSGEFEGISLALLFLAIIAGVGWGAVTAVLWFGSMPKVPDAGPATMELGDEPPAVANLLTNGWQLTRIAMAATLVDLAGRRILGIEDYAGGNHVVRIRSNQPQGERLADYERQVVQFVGSRATGGSAPVQALDLGEAGEAASFWNRFRKSVEKDARSRGLAQSRWTKRDRTIIGVGLAIALGLLAAALGAADITLGSETGDSDPIDGFDWFIGAAVLWAGTMVVLVRMDALRDTAAGRAACAQWLGVRRYYDDAGTFEDLPPGAVAVWERHMAYALAFGLAHGAAERLPMGADDPYSAWTRRHGHWRMIRIRYPKRFGFGEPPWKVFLVGLAMTVWWGGIAFVAFPVVASVVWDVAADFRTDYPEAEQQIYWFVLGFIGFLALVGVVVLVRAADGAIRLVLGAMDLGKRVTVEGEVVNRFMGRIAVDNGIDEETRAWTPPLGAPALHRGMLVRVTMSPRLCHVSQVEVLGEATPQLDHVAALAT